MAHKTMVNGTVYEVTGGRTLIGGTGYSIKGGRTLVGGTGYDINIGLEVGTKFEIRPDGNTYVFDADGNQTDMFQTDDTFVVPESGMYSLEIHGGGGGGGGGSTWPGGMISIAYYSPFFVVGSSGGGSGQIFACISLTKGDAVQVSVGKGGNGGISGRNDGVTVQSGSGSKGEASTFGDYTASGGYGGGGSHLYPAGSGGQFSLGGGGSAGDSGSENNVAEDGVAARGPYTSGSGTGMIGGSGGGEYGDTYGKGGYGGGANTSDAQPGDAGADGIIVLVYLGI